ncbi:SET domain-containing protein [Lepidopterella palustris CBS 459.81]|uniref:SET domain-containing protein n=1 Tax=Lepidopterella palustris CBS 459.81 TaxID=1314670 RepID=A0A8E2EC25_9PEZI|nr:SET domain-containing protein [Lepidopterella palustris CBS 459.81]
MASTTHTNGPIAPTPKPATTSDPASSDLFTLQLIPNKGKGLVAACSIHPGTLLISETPLFAIGSSATERDLATHVRSLPKESQRAFLSLHNSRAGKGDPFSNIVRTNAYPLGPGSDIGGIFPLIARINHSCRPNAQHAWNAKLSRETVYSVRPIAAGDEITLSYSSGGPSIERRKALKEMFGFECACEVCSLPAEDLRVSDERLRKAQLLDEAIGNPKRVMMNPENALADCRELLRLYRDEQIADLRIPRLYYDAFQICAMHADRARAKVFAQKSREARILCEGEDSVEGKVMMGFAVNPAGFENFGTTKKWRTDEVPVGLDADDFEKWLWKEK